MEEKKSFKELIAKGAGRIVFIAVLYAVILGLFILIVNLDNPVILYCFCAVFIYFGWQALNKITPNIFLIMPIVGWLIYYLVKGILSAIVGMFVAPLVIAKKIANSVVE